jgi:hypothetical protein
VALPYAIASSQTDAKSPVDDNLMDSIRLDLDYLDAALSTGSALFTMNVNGNLAGIANFKKMLDTAFLYNEFQPSRVRVALKKSGLSGNLQIDVRKHKEPHTPIIGIDHQYEGTTQGVARVSPGLLTQSVSRSTAQISTQSITFAKSAINVTSIIHVGGNKWRYNLDSTPDSDYIVGKTVVIGGTTAGANDGTFLILERNQSGYDSIVVTNVSGAAQTGAAGTVQLQLMSYNFSNPISTEFSSGELALFASHSTGANNGSLEIYKINQAGNNIWVFNATGATQGGVAGNANVWRWKFATTTTVTDPDFHIGEKAKMASHTSGSNDGSFTITALNLGSNNIVVYNPSGVVQGGVAGTINTNRWIYSLPSDPSSQISAGQTIFATGHTSALNDGTFTVKQVNRGAVNNVVVYNESGVAQGGVVGSVRHTRKLVKFATNQSLNYTTDSYVELVGCPDRLYNYRNSSAPHKVLEINRGGGSNFNIVIDVPEASVQSSPAGYVSTEMKSILSSDFIVPVDITSVEPNQHVIAETTDIVSALITAGDVVGLYILEVPTGAPTDLTVTIH